MSRVFLEISPPATSYRGKWPVSPVWRVHPAPLTFQHALTDLAISRA
jgi:hypothetical protein